MATGPDVWQKLLININVHNEKSLEIQQSSNTYTGFWTERTNGFRKKKNTPLSRNAANELHQGWKVVFNRPNTPLPAAPKYQATPTIPWMFSDYDLLVGLGWNSII